MSSDALPPRSPGKAAAVRSLCAVAILAALAYWAAPFTYTYFVGRPLFQFFPGRVGQLLATSPPGIAYEIAWGHAGPAGPFPPRDVTCALQPASTTDGCAHPLAARKIVYGPYIVLSEGLYRAQFVVEAPRDCASPIVADVSALNMRKAPVTSAQFQTGGKVELNLDFRVEQDLADKGAFEFRVLQTAGPACAVLRQVKIRRLAL